MMRRLCRNLKIGVDRLVHGRQSSAGGMWPHDHPVQFFADTNLLLQCEDLDKLSWSDVTTADRILVIVPKAVQIEIDRLKGDGNKRRARRARRANGLLRSAIQAPDFVIPIRTARPAVDLALAPETLKVRSRAEGLDLSCPDDAIIADAWALQCLVRGIIVSILTHDTNPLLTAKRVGVPATVVPDSWLLPPEPDERDKRIRELEDRVQDLSSQYPALQLCSGSDPLSTMAPVQMAVSLFDPLSNHEIEELTSLARELQPQCHDFNISPSPKSDGEGQDMNAVVQAIVGLYQYKPASDSAISRYRDTDYPEWVAQIERWLKDLNKHLYRQAATKEVSFALHNIGKVPASSLLLRIAVSEGFLILPPVDDSAPEDTSVLSPPPIPPQPPKGRWELAPPYGGLAHAFGKVVPQSPTLPHMSSLFTPDAKRDSYGFYWRPRKPIGCVTSWEFECDEFRHMSDAKTLNLRVLALMGTSGPRSGTIDVRASAANLPEPLRVAVPIVVTTSRGDTALRARECLVEHLTAVPSKSADGSGAER